MPNVVVQYEGVNDIGWKLLPRYKERHSWSVWLRGARVLRPLFPVGPAQMREDLAWPVENQQRMRQLCTTRGIRHVAATFALPDVSHAVPAFRALVDEEVTDEWGVHARLDGFAEYARLLDAYNDLMLAASARGALTVVDVRPALSAPGLYVDTCHHTPEGIARLAAAFEAPVEAAVAAVEDEQIAIRGRSPRGRQ